jgi:hypothetical protein
MFACLLLLVCGCGGDRDDARHGACAVFREAFPELLKNTPDAQILQEYRDELRRIGDITDLPERYEQARQLFANRDAVPRLLVAQCKAQVRSVSALVDATTSVLGTIPPEMPACPNIYQERREGDESFTAYPDAMRRRFDEVQARLVRIRGTIETSCRE